VERDNSIKNPSLHKLGFLVDLKILI